MKLVLFDPKILPIDLLYLLTYFNKNEIQIPNFKNNFMFYNSNNPKISNLNLQCAKFSKRRQ